MPPIGWATGSLFSPGKVTPSAKPVRASQPWVFTTTPVLLEEAKVMYRALNTNAERTLQLERVCSPASNRLDNMAVAWRHVCCADRVWSA